jgi:DNA topoisomerase-1
MVGAYEDKPVTAGVGRFGPFIRHDGKFISIPKEISPLSITLDKSIELIREKREKEARRSLKKFDEELELELLNGRYGPYIAYKGNNYKMPKSVKDPQALTLEEVMRIINEASEKTATSRKRIPRKK